MLYVGVEGVWGSRAKPKLPELEDPRTSRTVGAPNHALNGFRGPKTLLVVYLHPLRLSNTSCRKLAALNPKP